MSDQVDIMMVDDDRHISTMTRDFLQAKGYAVTLLHNADDAMSAVQVNDYDLCILDIQMPMKDGFTLAAEIQEIRPGMPVIFLTAKTAVEDRVKGLRLGAEDYITKPYSLEELDLRINNIIRRSQKGMESSVQTFEIGKWTFNPESRLISAGDHNKVLTTIESQLLLMLCYKAGGILSRDQALQEIWGDEYRVKESSLKVYISKLRKLFREDRDVEILNVHGIGYRLVVRA